jgi:cytochrome c-type biogenesis protein CcmH
MIFWIVAVVFIAAALAFVLLPLKRSRKGGHAPREAVNASVYRDQLRELDAELEAGNLDRAHYDEALRELEVRVLQDTEGEAAPAPRVSAAPRTAVAVGIAVPLLAVALYVTVGTPAILSPQWSASSKGTENQHMEAMVERLAARLAADPENANGWVMLARSYAALGRFGEAALAYANAAARIKDDAQLLADYADALAMAQGQSLEGEPERLVKSALAIDPDNVKALALAGTIAFGKRDFTGAVAHWERILRVQPESPFAQSVRNSIAEARAAAGTAASEPGSPPAADAAAPPKRADAKPASAPGAAGAISGVVRIAPEVAKAVSPTDTLFVFARATEGPRMPVAILRAQAKDLPFEFTLDDRNSMVAGMKLSDQKQVVIGARISKSGSATPQAGDVQGYSKPVVPGTRDLHIVLSDVAR